MDPAYKANLDLLVQSAQQRAGIGPAAQAEAAAPGFRSSQEVVSAMQDSRYRTDPAYRREVARRMATSGRVMGGRW